jgi:3-hydroxyisobutyrate dehydrogenase
LPVTFVTNISVAAGTETGTGEEVGRAGHSHGDHRRDRRIGERARRPARPLGVGLSGADAEPGRRGLARKGERMSRIAFLGLGQMGTPMAARLLATGHELSVWDRTQERTRPLAEKGAEVASHPATAARHSELAITMLATPGAVDEVLFGPHGLASALRPGQLLIEMSTIGPAAFASLASQLPEGVAAVDAPVLGSVPQATSGELHVYVGAGEDDFERVRPVLSSLGDVRHVGGPGAGAATKLVVNLTIGAAVVAFGEALALAKGLGLDRGTTLDVLAESPIAATVKSKRANVESRRYQLHFKLRHAVKDLDLVGEAARGAGLDLREARAAREWLDAALRHGAGDLDYSAVVGYIADADVAAMKEAA